MSGAQNNIPVLPTFTAGSPTIAQLNQLSYAVQFLVQQDVRPTWNDYNIGTNVGASGFNALVWNKVAFDCDGVGSGLGITIVTQGRYAVEACVSVQAPNAGDEFVATFLFNAGTNNPHFTTGTTQHFGWRGSSTSVSGSAVADNTICLSDIVPMALYPGDQITVVSALNAALTFDYNQNTSFTQGRFVSKFSGYWIGQAS